MLTVGLGQAQVLVYQRNRPGLATGSAVTENDRYSEPLDSVGLRFRANRDEFDRSAGDRRTSECKYGGYEGLEPTLVGGDECTCRYQSSDNDFS
jgi:hypothetical protein